MRTPIHHRQNRGDIHPNKSKNSKSKTSAQNKNNTNCTNTNKAKFNKQSGVLDKCATSIFKASEKKRHVATWNNCLHLKSDKGGRKSLCDAQLC